MPNLEQYNYHGEAPKPKFNTDYYSGKDLYCDGDIEDKIINIIASNPTTDYEKDINANYSWPTFYHLTHIRQNILSWYPFNEDADVLEIGCGMGAITELLCQKCSSVTAVELSQKRATATYLRCRNYDNLEIIVGNLNDINFTKQYDYITLIGVLEYQIKYTDSENPFKDFLEKIKKLLKPDGKLLIAIENKYGLKYWCGTPEDHSGTPFDGINNYSYSNVAKTFSRKELENLIKSAGFNNTFFYYPLPDYKFPQVIYSEKYLPRTGSMDNWTPYYYPNTKSLVADESNIYADVIENGVFEFFSNSFLVECALTDIMSDDKTLFVATTSFRKKEYRLTTVYSDQNGYRKIAGNDSQTMLYNIKDNHDLLRSNGIHISDITVNKNYLTSEYIKGISLTELLLNTYKSHDLKKIYGLWDRIYDEIKRSSKEADTLSNIFNSNSALTLSPLSDNDKLLASGFIDMIHKNCFVDNDNFIWIDQEWCLNNIPASFILFYNICELYIANIWINSIISYDDILKHYDIFYNKECYINLRTLFFNTVLNPYTANNYNHLSQIDNNNILNNINLLEKQLGTGSTAVKSANPTILAINSILQSKGILDMINYVGTLSNDTILKDIPVIPQFIVKYLNSDAANKEYMNNNIHSYYDIILIANN